MPLAPCGSCISFCPCECGPGSPVIRSDLHGSGPAVAVQVSPKLSAPRRAMTCRSHCESPPPWVPRHRAWKHRHVHASERQERGDIADALLPSSTVCADNPQAGALPASREVERALQRMKGALLPTGRGVWADMEPSEGKPATQPGHQTTPLLLGWKPPEPQDGGHRTLPAGPRGTAARGQERGRVGFPREKHGARNRSCVCPGPWHRCQQV